MRRDYSIILFVLIILTLSGCVDEEVIYNLGDKVTIDGINYELVSLDELGVRSTTDNFNEDGTFKEIDESKLYRKNDDRVGFLHQFYYYDMINYDNYPTLIAINIQNDFRNMRLFAGPSATGDYDPGICFESNDNREVDVTLVANFNDFYPSEAFYVDENGLAQNYKYYFSVTPYIDAIEKEVSDNVFVVRGYDKENVKEEVTIPRQIGEYDVAAIAYKALENAPMTSLTIEAGALMLYYPYSISNCPNLKKLSIENPMLMPAALSHMTLDELTISGNSYKPKTGQFIVNSFYAMDASFNDLIIGTLKTIPLSFVNPRVYCSIQHSNFDVFRKYAAAGTNFNLTFTDCSIDKVIMHNDNYGLEHFTRNISINNDTIFLDETVQIGINMSKKGYQLAEDYGWGLSTPFYRFIYYNFLDNYPIIKDGVCYSKYVDLMLKLGERRNVSQTIIFPYNLDYYIEDNFIKVKLNDHRHYAVRDNYIIKEDADVVLTLLEINPNNTYITKDGTVLYAHS